jgi:patatin-related protein
MHEKELRIALVCFGGVSLAIYMHGICKEVLKLVRASSALHAIPDRADRAAAAFFDGFDESDPEYDTEAVYFELLRDIGRDVELRVVVDIVAGASAGGINGTLLARALSHDLPVAAIRDLWLDNADVGVLLAPEARAGSWSKPFLKPLIWAAGATGLASSITDPEVRKNLSLFMRSRWFKAPLDGPLMSDLMYRAMIVLGAPKTPGSTLLPSNQSLDLFVTLTDYHGYDHPIQIHDPPFIHERHHHHVLHFAYERDAAGGVRSDFDLANAAALAFAARATSSFPGAFPPARIAEMDEIVAARAEPWPTREHFIERNFQGHLRADIDPSAACFIDGSVLNNRPFSEAIAAIQGRPAYRQVDRRLVYIDPSPAMPEGTDRLAYPGFFSTLKGALSDIPRNQPIADALDGVIDFNDQVRHLRGIIEGARPRVSRLVGDVISEPLARDLALASTTASDRIKAWREHVNAQVVREAGFAYEAYVRLKLAAVRGFISRLIVGLRRVPQRSPFANAISMIVDVWAAKSGFAYAEGEADGLAAGRRDPAKLPRWAELFLAFDVDYRKRRLNFLIEGQNRLFQMVLAKEIEGLAPRAISNLKRAFYRCLGTLRSRQQPQFFNGVTVALIRAIFAHGPEASEARDLNAYAEAFVARNGKKLDLLIERLAAEIKLDDTTRDVDNLLAALDPAEWPEKARHEVLVNYLGFPYFDVLTLPVTIKREAGEFREILIDRISPQDVHSLDGFGGSQSLKGIGFGYFAAFLSRAYRENDYLLGRLHAIDRLIDLVCDSAKLHPGSSRVDVAALKKAAFERVLAAEEPHLSRSGELIAALRRAIGKIRTAEAPARAAEGTREGETITPAAR